MCGRFAASRSLEELRRLFGTVNPLPDFAPSWNVAPGQLAPVVRRHPQSGARHLDLLRWGLLPHWVRAAEASRRPINARWETAASLPMFRDAFARRRCIVPAEAFYEWQATAGGKQPHAIARADGAPLALAGLWESWRGPDGAVLRSFVVLTTAASPALRALHARMPVMLEAADWPGWLGTDAAPALPPAVTALRFWPVATLVNNVRNDGAQLLDPVAVQQ